MVQSTNKSSVDLGWGTRTHSLTLKEKKSQILMEAKAARLTLPPLLLSDYNFRNKMEALAEMGLQKEDIHVYCTPQYPCLLLTGQSEYWGHVILS
jgi:hypothetical protein